MLQQTQPCKYLGIWLAFSGSHVIPLMLFDEPTYSFPPWWYRRTAPSPVCRGPILASTPVILCPFHSSMGRKWYLTVGLLVSPED